MPAATEPARARRTREPSRPRPSRARRRTKRRGGAAARARRLAWIRHAVEATGLVAVLLMAVVLALGGVADRLVGAGFWSHVLPFAAVVLGVGIAGALALRGWLLLRPRLAARAPWLPATVAGVLAVGTVALATRPAFDDELASLRRLTGGPTEAHRITLAHQVFAAYRRADLAGLTRIVERARVYEPTVREAADAFGVDPEVLMGVASAESSFDPRDSRDGGRGLFQITAPPAAALAQAKQALGTDAIDLRNQRHNAFVAAATLRLYLAQMQNDPFLGLLAYNIGPRNGGLRTIMDQYGAKDFVTVQPYLQNLPRDYPIRVLLGALAFRLWRAEGRLLRYEEGANARRIQALGVPMLDAPT
jgi:hypothetical protein